MLSRRLCLEIGFWHPLSYAYLFHNPLYHRRGDCGAYIHIGMAVGNTGWNLILWRKSLKQETFLWRQTTNSFCVANNWDVVTTASHICRKCWTALRFILAYIVPSELVEGALFCYCLCKYIIDGFAWEIVIFVVNLIGALEK